MKRERCQSEWMPERTSLREEGRVCSARKMTNASRFARDFALGKKCEGRREGPNVRRDNENRGYSRN